MLNMQMKPAGSAGGQKSKPPKGKPTLNVWESMGLDQRLSSRAVEMRKATS